MGKFLAILKMAADFIPALALGGSVSACIYCGVKSGEMQREVYDEIRQEQAVQMLVEEEKQNSQAQYDEGQLSYKDYHDYLKYLDSEEFLKEVVDTTEAFDTEAYKEKFAAADKMDTNSYWMFLPISVSSIVSIALYAPLNEGKPLVSEILQDQYEDFLEEVRKSKRMKKYKKMEKEYDDYKEELK